MLKKRHLIRYKKQDHTRPIEKRGDDPDIETLFDNRNCNAVPFFSTV